MPDEAISKMTPLPLSKYTGEEQTAVVQPTTSPGANFKGAALAGITTGAKAGPSGTGSTTVTLGVGATSSKGSNSVVLGANAVLKTGSSSTVIGANAGAGANSQVAIGQAANAGDGQLVTVIGAGAGNSGATGSLNTMAGAFTANILSTATGTVAIGYSALGVVTTGSKNTGVGLKAGLAVGTATGTVSLGALAGETKLGSLSIAIGLKTNAGGTNSVVIAPLLTNDANHSVVVGANATKTVSDNGVNINQVFQCDGTNTFIFAGSGNPLPTSAIGLPTGALWNNAGVLSIAP